MARNHDKAPWAASDNGSTLVLQTGGRVSITRRSTTFRVVQRQNARLLTGLSWFESTLGSHCGHLLTGKETRLSSGQCGIMARWPLQFAHVTDAGYEPVNRNRS